MRQPRKFDEFLTLPIEALEKEIARVQTLRRTTTVSFLRKGFDKRVNKLKSILKRRIQRKSH